MVARNVLMEEQPVSSTPAPAETLMQRFEGRQSNELVLAFAGPIGCGIKSVVNAARRSLLKLNYRVEVIKVSQFLEESLAAGRIQATVKDQEWSDPFYRYRKLQEAGKRIRELSENKHILAEFAVSQIVLDRERSRDEAVNAPVESYSQRVAYLIDQVKRPEEVDLLRALYRNLFYLVGVTKPYAQRKRLLEDDGVDETETEKLIEIDRSEEGLWGQQLDKTLHLADFFVRNDALVDQRNAIDRFVSLIHGDKSKTPDVLETGMYAAYAAGLRSACLSRQVGAAIANTNGDVIATGCNDVPAPKGGLYGGARSHQDHRCVHIGDRECFNDYYKRKLQEDIGYVLDVIFRENGVGNSGKILKQSLEAIYKKTRLGSLIEFSRSVHAEMDAIVSLARSGGEGIRGARLFTTTFPCHSCARHIVASGIEEVIYIEPYDKSMAQQLHRDAISFESPADYSEEMNDEDRRHQESKVKFLHFEGVSPRLFATVFRADGRKNKDTGRFVPIATENPAKVLPEYLDNYHAFEDAAVKHFAEKLSKLPSVKY
ncbi:deoxycytidylate deaminase [Roseateles chitinivorans]|uniref:Deoxycytidylate deaminase n=1 Tax=Roseateles chitinivorans TaxID=2917965 RepID=A0A2G9CA98_9BURK|nr:anti-phage dCTP deaminase [Roseateles chitinivorans]PIM53350.1 deoxycytidylate deaminase [Roseateles chitinivorans]